MNNTRTQKKKVLVAGASGLLGVAATEKFLSAGWEVIGVDQRLFRAIATPVMVAIHPPGLLLASLLTNRQFESFCAKVPQGPPELIWS
jgi:nucleoside-diphosphate-sugar epimerase